MSFNKILKCASLATFIVGSGSLGYYLYRNRLNSNMDVEVLDCNLNGFNDGDTGSISDVISKIDNTNVSRSEMEEINKLLRMKLTNQDYICVLNLITSISSFTKNIDPIIHSGCLNTILEIFEKLPCTKDTFVTAIINPLKNIACSQNSLIVFKPFVKSIIDHCEAENMSLKFGSLSLLVNLVLIPQLDNEKSDCAKEILIHIDQIFTWLLGDRKDATVKLLLNISHCGIEYRKKIMNCKKEKVFSVFLDLLQQTNVNVFILLRLFFEDLKIYNSLEEKSFGKYLMNNRESFMKITEMKSLGETRDIDIVRNLLHVLSSF